MTEIKDEILENKCPNCAIVFETTSIADVSSGDVTIDATVEYCPKCLYVNMSDVELSHY